VPSNGISKRRFLEPQLEDSLPSLSHAEHGDLEKKEERKATKFFAKKDRGVDRCKDSGLPLAEATKEEEGGSGRSAQGKKGGTSHRKSQRGDGVGENSEVVRKKGEHLLRVKNQAREISRGGTGTMCSGD